MKQRQSHRFCHGDSAGSGPVDGELLLTVLSRHLAVAGVDSPVHAEAVELLGRHDQLTGEYRDEVTERARFVNDQAQPRRRPRTLIVPVSAAAS